MPTKRSQLTKAEQDEYRASLLQLEEMGTVTRGTEDPRSQRKRFTLEQVDSELARVYDLPGGDVAAVLPAKLIVLKSGVMITDSKMFPPWDNWGLDLNSPEENRFFADLIRGLPAFPPAILNHRLVGYPVPLRPCQREGVIIATGWSSVPVMCRDETRVNLELWLRDEQGAELRYDFKARVDRSIKTKYERGRPDPRVVAERLAKRAPLFGPDEANLAPGTMQPVTRSIYRKTI